MEATREMIHQMVENIDNSNLGIVRHILAGFIPEDEPLTDEIEAIRRSEVSVAKYGTVDFDDVNWD